MTARILLTPPKSLWLSLLKTMAVGVPAYMGVRYALQYSTQWASSDRLFMAVILMAAMNFVLLLFLESHFKTLGKYTLPSILASIGIVILFVIVGAINRFFANFGYSLLMPFVVLGFATGVWALLHEKNMPLKILLALNGLALAVLWALGVADKIAVPV